ncbi:MAG: cysteine dioxygenase family protein [Acidobacteria bacterium]|nr:cysteine dioxygenase family protein [Acidobacteriota bacterium]
MESSSAHQTSVVPFGETVSLDEYVREIESLSKGLITKQAIADLVLRYRIRDEDLARFKSWNPSKHTRNLIFRNQMIELMLICWNAGTVTPLHTHNGQLGWMVVVEGTLVVENYRMNRCNKPENQQVVGIDCVAGATEIEMELINTETVPPWSALNTVDKTQTIHRIVNPPENGPAVSLHIYSQPIDSCVVFDMEQQRCARRELSYDTKPE